MAHRALTDKIASLVIGLWSLLILAVLIALGWFGWRALFRSAEKSFWALNSVVVEPSYAAFREVLPAIAERLFRPQRQRRPAREAARRLGCRRRDFGVRPGPVRALARLAESASLGSLAEIESWKKVAVVALANSVAAITAYLAVAALAWGFADAAMAQPRDLAKFAPGAEAEAATWRIAHLSDVHVVGERYGLGASRAAARARRQRTLEASC